MGTWSYLRVCILIFAILFSLPVIAAHADGFDLESTLQKLQQRVDKLEQQNAVSQNQFSTNKTIFAKTLQAGASGDQVRDLQEFLKQFPDIYPEGLVTGYFGPLTENAVKRFQIKEGIEAVGIIGPITRNRLNEFMMKGVIGPIGATGVIGLTGNTGAVGATGNVGATGVAGAIGAVGNTGVMGAPGYDGATGRVGVAGAAGAVGATGDIGATGSVGVTGATGLTGNTGAAGAVGSAGATGVAGAVGVAGATGDTGVTGATGLTGNTGSAGAAGSAGAVGATGAVGGVGATGGTGTAGATGATGATGTAGATGATGVISSAQYFQPGAQPATVGAGQPFTYSTTVLSTSVITSSTAVFNPPFTTSGTVFTLVNIGRYEIDYQMTYPTDGGVILYFGPTVASMSPLAYTMIGKTTDGIVRGNVIIQTTVSNSFLSVNAAPGNTAAIAIPPNSSTTNQSATTISFKQIQ